MLPVFKSVVRTTSLILFILQRVACISTAVFLKWELLVSVMAFEYWRNLSPIMDLSTPYILQILRVATKEMKGSIHAVTFLPITCQMLPLLNNSVMRLNVWRRNYFFLNFSTPCIQNVNNTGTKYVRIMKQTAFWREKRRVYTTFKVFSTYIFWINI
jgi:hypothetical protein